jgi:hypothetical protein
MSAKMALNKISHRFLSCEKEIAGFGEKLLIFKHTAS